MVGAEAGAVAGAAALRGRMSRGLIWVAGGRGRLEAETRISRGSGWGIARRGAQRAGRREARGQEVLSSDGAGAREG